VGENLGAWRAWDGIRALDYLLSREEVDPNQVGVTGNSGGGTMTTWLCGVEERWTMAAASCFVSTFRRNLENEEAQDTEQCPPRALALGLDHADFLAASAPDPIIILAKEKDFFDVRGSEETYAQLKHLYGLLGVEEKIGFFAGKGPHGYSQDNREAMYRWFNSVTKLSDSSAEPEIVKEKDEALHCAPQGQVAALQSKTVFDFTKEKSQRLAQERPSYADEAALRDAVVKSLRLPMPLPTQAPDFRILKNATTHKYPKPKHTRYAIETEPGIQAIVHRLSEESLPARPTKDKPKAVLYIAQISSDYELAKEPLVREMVEKESDAVFYACDVRGIGESRPDVCGKNAFLNPYGSDYMHAVHGIMLDEPYTGRKTLDVLQVLNWLREHGHSSVHLAGRGWGAIPATFAALLSDAVTQVTLKAAPASYSEIAETEYYEWPLSTLLPNVLEHFDLPDCYHMLKRKQLRLLGVEEV
jgi:dienelactone hydrolase